MFTGNSFVHVSLREAGSPQVGRCSLDNHTPLKIKLASLQATRYRTPLKMKFFSSQYNAVSYRIEWTKQIFLEFEWLENGNSALFVSDRL